MSQQSGFHLPPLLLLCLLPPAFAPLLPQEGSRRGLPSWPRAAGAPRPRAAFCAVGHTPTPGFPFSLPSAFPYPDFSFPARTLKVSRSPGNRSGLLLSLLILCSHPLGPLRPDAGRPSTCCWSCPQLSPSLRTIAPFHPSFLQF